MEFKLLLVTSFLILTATNDARSDIPCGGAGTLESELAIVPGKQPCTIPVGT